MSLDVYLTLKGVQNKIPGSRIFIREGGSTKEISRSEWDERFPGRESVVTELPSDDEEVFSANITHNLGEMASAAGLYRPLWRPSEIGITKAAQLIEPLELGLKILKDDPDKFKEFNPENGWGSYGGLVAFVEEYIAACHSYPDAEVSVSR